MLVALSSRPVSDSIENVNSVRVLKELVRLEAERVDTQLKNAGYHENNLLIYFKWYFTFLHYMNVIRIKFETSILSILQPHFNPYQRPSVTSEHSLLGSRNSDGGTSLSMDGFDGKNKVRLKALTLLGTDYSSLKKAYDTTDVEIIMGALNIVMAQWSELLVEDTVLNTEYLKDLYQNIDPTQKVQNGNSNSNIIHIVPLALTMCEKSAAFADEWIRNHKRKRDMLKIHLHDVKKADGETEVRT